MQNFNFIKFCFLFLTLLCSSCSEMWGDGKLGGHFSLLQGDRKEDRLIVYCSGKSSDGSCFAGIPLVPTYDRQFDSKGHYREYVEIAKSNEDWIIAKTMLVEDRYENFWIINKHFSLDSLNCDKINCDSIIQLHINGPMDSSTFQNKRKALGVSINF